MTTNEEKIDSWNAIEDSEGGPMTYESRRYEKTPQKDRGRVLLRALEVINGERQQSYGDPEDSFEEISWVWNWWLDSDNAPITAADVAMMMCLMKLAREKNGAGKTDNVVDACGYLGLYEDMRGEEK